MLSENEKIKSEWKNFFDELLNEEADGNQLLKKIWEMEQCSHMNIGYKAFKGILETQWISIRKKETLKKQKAGFQN